MKKTILLFVLVFFISAKQSLFAQPGWQDTVVVYKGTLDKQPEFPGGQQVWARYVDKHIDTTLQSRYHAPDGKYTATITFLIDEWGRVSRFKIDKNAGYGTGEEAVRIIKSGPQWKPAEANGKPVSVMQTISVTFNFSKD